jgi:hypothetical protein
VVKSLSLSLSQVELAEKIEKPFVAWDGEGITHPGNDVQSYCLFGCSLGDRIIARSLSTVDCLELLLRVEAREPNAIHVGFALGYDVNMILKDMPKRVLYPLWKGEYCHYDKYRIEYRPGKWLMVSEGKKGGKAKRTAKLYDVFGFFQSSFVKACTEFLGENDPLLQRVIDGKKLRSVFTWDELLPYVVPYWESELSLLVRLMEALRSDLVSAGIPIESWHGPGAVANKTLRTFNIQSAKYDCPTEVKNAARYAYAGGRFEQFGTGYYPGKVYQYDIRSAYPSHIRRLPNLSKGHWRFSANFKPDTFGVWRFDFTSKHAPVSGQKLPQPFFYRDNGGRISFPPMVSSWAWTPEASLAPEAVRDGWVFEPDNEERPFAFVDEFYELRAQWKREGNSAQRALKLALNSLYGKMAQRAGYREGRMIPKWHQLEWAGYVTSSVRAQLWHAMSQAKYNTIALETDAIFATKPLDLPLSEKLGDWELTVLDDILYVQSGFYYAHKDGKLIEKYRGFDKGSVPFDQVMSHLEAIDRGETVRLSGPTTRFVGLGLALHTKAVWRSWQTTDRRIVVGGGGKRAHIPWLCRQCKASKPLVGWLHQCTTTTVGGVSEPHPLPWETNPWDLMDRIDSECQF